MQRIPAKRQNPIAISCISETNTTLVFDICKLFPDKIPSGKTTYTFSIKNLTPELYGQETFDYINTHFYVNGSQLSLMQNKAAEVVANSKSSDIIFVVYCDEPNMRYEFRLDCEVSYNDNTHNVIIVHTSDADILPVYNNSGADTMSDGSSFGLLRTNPKLTGNVKLIVSNNRLYMDTFRYKTADALSNIKFRKRQLSSYGDYPNDLFRVFGRLDSNTFMDVIPDCYNPYKVYTNPSEHYNTTYEYGCEKNTDKLYKENFRLLAPLHIGYSLPDYFLVFAKPVSTTSLLKPVAKTTPLYEHIKHGRLVKAFSLRENTIYGAYLRNYAKNLEKYSIDNIYYNGTKIKFMKTTDTVMGIDYKYGVFTEKQFASSDVNLSIEELNTYYTDSFKAKNLVYPWILNFEFMFDDPEAIDYQIYNYYGFYVTENEFQHISKVIDSQNSVTSIREFYNGSDILDTNAIFSKSVTKFGSSECMFSISSDKNFQLLQTKNDFDLFIKKNVLNKPGQLLAQPRVKKFTLNDIESFLTIKFDKQIKPGEHFRFIISNKKGLFTASTIYEIIASNDVNLCRHNVPISQYILTNKIKNCNIYSLSFYTGKEDGSDGLAELKDQIFRIGECIAKFQSFLWTGFVGKDSISINSLEQDVLFQHIAEPAAKAGDIDHLHYVNCDNDSELEDIHRFNLEVLYPFNNPVYDTNDTRVSTLVKFVEAKSFNGFKLYEISDEIDEAINEAPMPMYLTISGDYKPLQNINVITNGSVITLLDIDDKYVIEDSLYIFLSPYREGRHFIALKEDPVLSNGCLNIFSSIECSINILGFLNIKDLDSQVDSPRQIYYNGSPEITLENNYILMNDNKTLKRFVKYIMVSGGFLNLKVPIGSAFMFVDNNKILHFNKGRSYFSEIPDTGLVTNGITIIRPDDMVSAGSYTYSYYQPGMVANNFIPVNMKNKLLDVSKPLTLTGSNSKMLSPIVPALSFNWEITGTTFDNNRLICRGDYSKYNQIEMRGAFYDTGAMSSIPSPDRKVIYNDEALTIRELVKKHPAYLKILYKDVPTASCYYNEATGSIEFVYNNILFKLNVTESASDSQRSVAIPDNIFNMKIAVINDFNMSMDNELFISEENRYMLLVNHRYFTGGDYRYANNIKLYTGGGIYCIDYYWTHTPYKFSLIDAFYEDNKFMFPMIVNNDSGIPERLSETNTKNSTYIQVGYPIYGHSVDLLEPSVYFQTSGDITNIRYNKHTGYYNVCKGSQILLGHDLWMETRDNKTASVSSQGFANYFTLASRYEPNNFYNIFKSNVNDGIYDYDVIDKTDNRMYDSFILSDLKYDNGYNESTSVNDLIEWTKSIAGNSIYIWIVSENSEPFLLNSTGINIDVVPPDYNNKFPGFFIKPAFRDNITFRTSELISESIGADLKNTGIIPDYVNNIDAYPYNIISGLSSKFIEPERVQGTKRKTKNFGFTTKNIIIPSWQSGNLPKDYKTSISAVSLQQLAPYTSMKSFFGSCCVAIPESDSIEITVTPDLYTTKISLLKSGENVNANLNVIQSQVKELGQSTNIIFPGTQSKARRYYKMSINVTEVFVNYIMSQQGFQANWGIFTSGVKKMNKTQMVDFIKKQILPSYNLENTSAALKARILVPVSQLNNEPDAIYQGSILTNSRSLGNFTINSKIPEAFIDNNKVRFKKQNNGDIVMEIILSVYHAYFVTPVLTIPKI